MADYTVSGGTVKAKVTLDLTWDATGADAIASTEAELKKVVEGDVRADLNNDPDRMIGFATGRGITVESVDTSGLQTAKVENG